MSHLSLRYAKRQDRLKRASRPCLVFLYGRSKIVSKAVEHPLVLRVLLYALLTRTPRLCSMSRNRGRTRPGHTLQRTAGRVKSLACTTDALRFGQSGELGR